MHVNGKGHWWALDACYLQRVMGCALARAGPRVPRTDGASWVSSGDCVRYLPC